MNQQFMGLPGVSYPARLERWGHVPGVSYPSRSRRTGGRVPTYSEDAIVAAYRELGSMTAVARQCGCGLRTVFRLLHGAGERVHRSGVWKARRKSA